VLPVLTRHADEPIAEIIRVALDEIANAPGLLDLL
jgi:hypothetical protein